MQVRSFKRQALAFAVAAAFPSTLLAQTLPSGFSLGAGQATLSYSPGHLQVDQASDKAVLNWQSFSIGAGGTVNFSQPSTSSVALNRVLGNNPSNGDRISLDMVGDNLIRVSVEQAALNAAVVHTGNVEAFGGNVVLAAHSANALLDTVLNTRGFVRAARMSEVDGQIVLDGGPRGTVAIGGQVFSDGHMRIAAADVAVSGIVSSAGGQDVAARSLSLVASDPAGGASLFNTGGDQVITISGNGASAGIDVVASGGGFASISHFDPNPAFGQTIVVTDADHIRVVGHDRGSQQFPAGAGIFAGTSHQAISITGSGRNAIVVGAEGATGQSVINGISQTITAGDAGQSGSITVTGTAASNVFAGISTNPSVGGTQTIRTSGALTVKGGSAPSTTFGAGVFHNGQERQTVRAGGIDVMAGSTGSGNSAFLNTNNGADQWIEVSGGTIRVVSGQGGANNTAGMGTNGRGNQTIVGRPDHRPQAGEDRQRPAAGTRRVEKKRPACAGLFLLKRVLTAA